MELVVKIYVDWNDEYYFELIYKILIEIYFYIFKEKVLD